MITHILDTDILVFWLRGSEKIERLALAIGLEHISSVSLAELWYGAYKSAQPERNMQAVQTVQGRLMRLPFGEQAEQAFGRIKADLEKQGFPLDDADLMIACTALVHDAILITNNTSHMSRIPGLRLEAWL
jgi:tRNA(fMet)-specific endonuclease VapC